MTKLAASFPLSGSSDSLSMNLVAPPFTTALTISSVPSTPLAASCIGSLNPDPQIPQTSLYASSEEFVGCLSKMNTFFVVLERLERRHLDHVSRRGVESYVLAVLDRRARGG
jgi:hypothetical protein